MSEDEQLAREIAQPHASGTFGQIPHDFRSQLTLGEEIVDPTTWAGSLPAASGIAPHVRIGRGKWFNLLWLLPLGFLGLIVAVAIAKGLRDMPSVQRFIARYPGSVEPARSLRNEGLPLWVGVQHFC